MAEGIATKRAEEQKPLAVPATGSVIARMDEIFDTISRRAFEIFEVDGGVFGRDLDNWLRAEREVLHPIHITVYESDRAFEVKAEVPGFTEKELEINVAPRTLTIAGKREVKKEDQSGKTVYAEECSNQVLRVVHLPAEIDLDKTAATLKNGVLDITMPKSTKSPSVRIQPKTA